MDKGFTSDVATSKCYYCGKVAGCERSCSAEIWPYDNGKCLFWFISSRVSPAILRKRLRSKWSINCNDDLDKDEINIDITSTESIDEKIDLIIKYHGRIDGWVNNAYPRTKDWGEKFEEIRFQSWETNISWQMNSYFYCMQKTLEIMKKQGFGKVVTVSSVNAVFGVEKETAYSVAKAGVLQLTRSLAKELRKDGINVNCIMPGPVKTRRFMSTLKGRNKHDLEKINSTSRLDRVANPVDIAPVVEFLFSDASDFISGELIRVDGGLFPQPM